MRKTLLVLIFFIGNFFIFARGSIELPQNPINLGRIEVSDNKRQIEIFLPYNKPEGIDEIYSMDLIGISISLIKGDGRIIRPRRLWMGSNDSLREREAYVEGIETENMNLYFRMVWNRYIDGNKAFLYYRTVNLNRGETFGYSIPINTREIYITYRIRFPDRPETEATEEQTIFFEIDWL